MTEYTNTPILPEKAKELMSLDTEYIGSEPAATPLRASARWESP